MRDLLRDLVLQAWQNKNALFYLGLVPLSWLFGGLAALRRGCYKYGIFKSYALPVPVIIVGNISLGGTGKTPVVMWLVEQLKQRGYKLGVISRGYGATISAPVSVNANSQASEVGDEPLLIFKRSACPVFVGPNRVQAGQNLLKVTKELDTIAFEVPNQINPFHEMEARCSRITVLLPRDSSANARLDSNTS